METLTSIAQIMAIGMPGLFLRILLPYALLGLGMTLTVAYTARQLWQLKAMRFARAAVPASR